MVLSRTHGSTGNLSLQRQKLEREVAQLLEELQNDAAVHIQCLVRSHQAQQKVAAARRTARADEEIIVTEIRQEVRGGATTSQTTPSLAVTSGAGEEEDTRVTSSAKPDVVLPDEPIVNNIVPWSGLQVVCHEYLQAQAQAAPDDPCIHESMLHGKEFHIETRDDCTVASSICPSIF